jgi:general stress protein YciG
VRHGSEVRQQIAIALASEALGRRQLARSLAYDLQLVENAEATAQIRGGIVPRKLKLVKSTSFAMHPDVTYRFMRKIGRKGGAHSRSNMTRRQASELGRRAARARWAKAAKATRPWVGTSRTKP